MLLIRNFLNSFFAVDWKRECTSKTNSLMEVPGRKLFIFHDSLWFHPCSTRGVVNALLCDFSLTKHNSKWMKLKGANGTKNSHWNSLHCHSPSERTTVARLVHFPHPRYTFWREKKDQHHLTHLFAESLRPEITIITGRSVLQTFGGNVRFRKVQFWCGPGKRNSKTSFANFMLQRR